MNKSKIIHYLQLVRLHKPIGILLLLWPTLWALWLASNGVPDLKIVLIFVAGVVLTRAAGCAINDIADREVDAHVRRTAQRPLAAQKISSAEAMTIFALLAVVAFCCVLLLNWLTIALSVVGLVLMVVYPFMKRVTHWPQLVLGAAFAWGVPMAFAAVQNRVPTVAWCLFGITYLWIVAYDTLYAMVDREDDLVIGVKSTAIAFGRYDVVMVLLLQFAVLFGLYALGVALHFSVFYFVAVVLAAGSVLYQGWLIKDRDPQRCMQAFLHNNWVGFLVFIGFLLQR